MYESTFERKLCEHIKAPGNIAIRSGTPGAPGDTHLYALPPRDLIYSQSFRSKVLSYIKSLLQVVE